MRWALFCALVLGGIHAYLGFHVVRRGVLFVDLAMAQMAALGAAVAVVAGVEHGTPAEYVLSLSFALSAAAFLAVVRSRRVPHEALIAALYGLASAATFVVLEHSPHGMDEVRHLLIGQILTVDPAHVLRTALLYAVVGAAHVRLYGSVLAVSEERPVTHGRWIEFFFYGTFALVVTSSVALVGVLVVFALLVLPAVSATLVASRARTRLLLGWLFALLGSLVGLHVAFHADSPAGPIIVLTLGAFLVGSALVRLAKRLASGGGTRIPS